jgi:peptide-methionine (R)-S-oxide reductase
MSLSDEQRRILHHKGTEPPFTGRYWDHHAPGTYHCAACGQALFESDTKFDSGTGWPSFSAALPDATNLTPDSSHGMERTEVICSSCGGHLGHLFPDGPPPTHQRYCINSASLEFTPGAIKD